MNSQRIVELAKHEFVRRKSHSYTNSVVLDGFLVEQPKFIETKIGISVLFSLVQIDNSFGDILLKSFPCTSFQKSVYERMKKINSVAFMRIAAILMWNPQLKSYNPQVYNFELVELVDEKLEPPYERRKGHGES